MPDSLKTMGTPVAQKWKLQWWQHTHVVPSGYVVQPGRMPASMKKLGAQVAQVEEPQGWQIAHVGHQDTWCGRAVCL